MAARDPGTAWVNIERELGSTTYQHRWARAGQRQHRIVLPLSPDNLSYKTTVSIAFMDLVTIQIARVGSSGNIQCDGSSVYGVSFMITLLSV